MTEWFQTAYSIVALFAIVLMLIPGGLLMLYLGVLSFNYVRSAAVDELTALLKFRS